MNFEGYGDLSGIDVAPADDAIVLRQSSVGSMDLCPARQGYLMSGEAVQVPSEAMSFGTMIHSFAEWRLEGNDGVVVIPMLQEWWEDAVAKDGFDLHELVSDDVLAASLQEALHACAAWDSVVYPTLGLSDEVTLEKTLLAPMGMTPSGREVWLRGTADVVDVGNRRILDWKTAGRGWKQSKAASTHQAQAYSFLVEADTQVQILDFTYWVWNRQKREWVAHVTTRNEAQVDAWLRHAWQRALQVEAGSFPFTPWQTTYGETSRGWWCSAKFCPAWDVCVGKHLPDDVWEEQAIDIKAGWSK